VFTIAFATFLTKQVRSGDPTLGGPKRGRRHQDDVGNFYRDGRSGEGAPPDPHSAPTSERALVIQARETPRKRTTTQPAPSRPE